MPAILRLSGESISTAGFITFDDARAAYAAQLKAFHTELDSAAAEDFAKGLADHYFEQWESQFKEIVEFGREAGRRAVTAKAVRN